MQNNTKQPLTDNLLRQPGQSLDEEINNLLDNQVLVYVISSIFLIMLSIHEWYKWYLQKPPSPLIYTIMAIVVTVYSMYKIIPLRRYIKMLKQGRDGERAVAELLNFFREAKMKIFHDVIGDSFNIDHVVVSTKGIYLVETKTYSKPEKGNAEIVFDGNCLYKNGQSIGDSILIQVTAGRSWLSNLIEELTAKKFEVQPVVVFPGWYVKMPNKKTDIWVLNPKGLSAWINNRPEVLSEEDVKLISNHLGRYIRKG